MFARIPAEMNPWGSRSLEWQLPSPVPVHDFDRIPVITSDPYDYGGAVPVGAPAPAPAGRRVSGAELPQPSTAYEIVEGEPPEQLGRNLNSSGHLLASATAFFFLAFVFAYVSTSAR